MRRIEGTDGKQRGINASNEVGGTRRMMKHRRRYRNTLVAAVPLFLLEKSLSLLSEVRKAWRIIAARHLSPSKRHGSTRPEEESMDAFVVK